MDDETHRLSRPTLTRPGRILGEGRPRSPALRAHVPSGTRRPPLRQTAPPRSARERVAAGRSGTGRLLGMAAPQRGPIAEKGPMVIGPYREPVGVACARKAHAPTGRRGPPEESPSPAPSTDNRHPEAVRSWCRPWGGGRGRRRGGSRRQSGGWARRGGPGRRRSRRGSRGRRGRGQLDPHLGHPDSPVAVDSPRGRVLSGQPDGRRVCWVEGGARIIAPAATQSAEIGSLTRVESDRTSDLEKRPSGSLIPRPCSRIRMRGGGRKDHKKIPIPVQSDGRIHQVPPRQPDVETLQ